MTCWVPTVWLLGNALPVPPQIPGLDLFPLECGNIICRYLCREGFSKLKQSWVLGCLFTLVLFVLKLSFLFFYRKKNPTFLLNSIKKNQTTHSRTKKNGKKPAEGLVPRNSKGIQQSLLRGSQVFYIFYRGDEVSKHSFSNFVVDPNQIRVLYLPLVGQ